MPIPLLVALQFLTTIPVYFNVPPSPQEQGRSLDWYGAVGLLIGVLLALIAWLLGQFLAPMPTAALVLTAWVVLTGGLHLGGLGDCADGCMGSSRSRTFEIMKDPRAGSMAVAAITLVLLIKFAALTVLVDKGAWTLLVAAPLLARVGAQALFLTTPYVHEDGPGAALAENLDHRQVLVAAVIALVIGAILIGTSAWLILPLLALVFAVVRVLMMRKLLGTTGDSAGALIVILEAAVLVMAV